MEKCILDYDYCPDLVSMPQGKLVCVVSTVVSFDEHQRFHRLATVPQRQHFQFRGSLPSGMASHSLLLVRVESAGSVPILQQTTESICLSHPECTWQSSKELIEFCAGMGALGQVH